MASSLHDDWLRRYFVDAILKPYVSEGTELITEVVNDLSKDAQVLFVTVIRADGKCITLSGELKTGVARWPEVPKELLLQLKMVG